MKDLGNASKILGVKIFRDRKTKTMFLSQEDYINKVLDKFSMNNAKPSPVPLGGHLILSRKDCPSTDSDKKQMQKVPYDVATGSVMYAMLCTRPDLAFAISVLSRFMSNPGEPHWLAMKYLLKYIFGTKNYGLIYSNHEPNSGIVGYVDSDYAGDKENRKSTTGYFFTWRGNCVSWKSQQQSIVTLSSTEAEYVAATEALKEALWLKGISAEVLGHKIIPEIYSDSQSALYLSKDPVYHERTKHIDVRYHFIRDKVESNEVVLKKISGSLNPADFGTKVVQTDKFHFCRCKLHIEAIS